MHISHKLVHMGGTTPQPNPGLEEELTALLVTVIHPQVARPIVRNPGAHILLVVTCAVGGRFEISLENGQSVSQSVCK